MKYHLRAFLNHDRWRPFRQFIEAWLQEWLSFDRMQGKTTLVLIGANAGYTLPRQFVSQFRHVVLVEPDPMAYFLFEARFNCKTQWVSRDFFGLSKKAAKPERLRELFMAYPNAAFLFCNILGQLPVLLRDLGNKEIEAYMQSLAGVLSEYTPTHALASYHDRYSMHIRRPNELVDHLTANLFSHAIDKKEFPWKLSKREEHQIEFVRFGRKLDNPAQG